jgi:hypothetical protein
VTLVTALASLGSKNLGLLFSEVIIPLGFLSGLIAWQKGVELVTDVYGISQKSSQTRDLRAEHSDSASGRFRYPATLPKARGGFLQENSNGSCGSAFKLETQIVIAKNSSATSSPMKRTGIGSNERIGTSSQRLIEITGRKIEALPLVSDY